MQDYTKKELADALRAIDSIIQKCQKAQEKFSEGNSHHTLLRNRLKAMYISRAFIIDALSKIVDPFALQNLTEGICDAGILLQNSDKLHTTDLGIGRIRRNLQLDVTDIVDWCRKKINDPKSKITQRGKNWYITLENCEITVNARSYTIITAHRNK